MFIPASYPLAVALCVVTMLCWGSWANMQKLATGRWPFQLFYWDYAIGIVVFSLLSGLTAGSIGAEGRSFVSDLSQGDLSAFGSAFLGGVIFNIANLLVVAAIDLAGLAVAFPVGIGLALVLGVVVNYLGAPVGDAGFLFAGVGLVAVAIVLDALAYGRLSSGREETPRKGILLALGGGVLMGFFFRFVAEAVTTDFVSPEPGRLTPYTAVFIFSLGVFVSNFLWNTIFMRKPVKGQPVKYSDYVRLGTGRLHGIGMLGGAIWCLGMSLSLIASEQAGFAISYGLGQGATMVAAAWGVFVWREFEGAPAGTSRLLTAMFACFIAGLGLIIYARVA